MIIYKVCEVNDKGENYFLIKRETFEAFGYDVRWFNLSVSSLLLVLFSIFLFITSDLRQGKPHCPFIL